MLPCDVMVKDVPAVRAVTSTEVPIVPATVWRVKNILLFAVTAVVATVTVPATSVANPIFAFDPSFTKRPFPAAPIFTFPIPKVASSVEPETVSHTPYAPLYKL